MKNIFVFFVLIFCYNVAYSQFVTIPDANFRYKLVQLYPSCFNANEEMDTTCISIVNEDSLNVFLFNISNLDGIQYFDNLEYLFCDKNQLTSLPNLPSNLKELSCSQNDLTSLLNLPSSLLELNCSYNHLTTLPTLPNTLVKLNCNGNDLTNLPTLPNSLKDLDCNSNQLTILPTLPNSLIYLHVSSNQLTILPALPNTIEHFSCSVNKLTNLPALPDSLIILNCGSNTLTSLPALPSNLKNLSCFHNQLTFMPTLPSSLMLLTTESNPLTSLPILPNGLNFLNCSWNQLTSLPSLPDSLEGLYCHNNLLTSLPSLPDSILFINCSYNPTLSCLPLLPNSLLDVITDSTSISCIPNIPLGMNSTLPICSNITACETAPTASGLVFLDINANQIYDLGVDSVLKDWVVTNSNGWSSVSLPNGEYIVKLDSGVLNTLTLNPLTYSSVSPTSYSITPTFSGSQGNNFHFAVNFIPVQDLSTYISAGVARPGFDQWVSVSVNNVGTIPVNNATLKVLKPTFASFLNANPPISSQNADTLIWNNVNINTLNTQNFNINWNISSAASIGTAYEIKSWITPLDTTPNNNAHVYNDFVRGSYDPNDKKVNLLLLDPLTLNSELVYTIRFQNTGTDTAFNILIRDTLSNHLDMSSFRIISASHDHTFLLRDHSLLEVFFQNILLPDSNTNEPKSHGYVTYAVKPKSTLQIGENIENTAYIFFDFNLPIVTNTTQTFIVTISRDSNVETKEAKIYPNPAQDEVLFENAEDASIQLFDFTGKLVLETEVKEGKINVASVPNGMYIVNLFRDNIQILQTKLSIQK